MEKDNVDVNKPTDGVKPEGGGESSAPQENVSSPEVKSEVKPEAQPESVKPDKDREHIENLNIALRQERESHKRSEEKLSQLESQFKETSDLLGRFKKAINPEEEKPKLPEYMTKEEADVFWKQKAEELEAKQSERETLKVVQEQIKSTEKEWDGQNGKPKYDDQAVLKWQKDNNKLYLSPREAFFEKEHSAIIDWEVKQQLSGKKPVIDVEKPSGGEQIHQPQETKPKTEQEIHQAVLEAMNNAEKEL